MNTSMKKRKICFISLMLLLLFSAGCQAVSDSNPKSTESGQPVPIQPAASGEAAGAKRYIPEYHILPPTGTVQEAFFNGDDITLLTATGYIAVGTGETQLYRGNLNSLELTQTELPRPDGEIIQSLCTVGDAAGLEAIYLITGNAYVWAAKEQEPRNHLLKVDKDGTLLEAIDISGIFTEETELNIAGQEVEPLVAGMEVDEEGNIFCFSAMGEGITVLNPQGEVLSVLEVGDVVTDLCTAHGTIYVSYFLNGVLTVGEIDATAQKPRPVFEEPEATFSFSMTEGPEGGLLCTVNGQTRIQSLGNGESTPLLEWQDYDTNSDHIANLTYLADGRIMAVDTDAAGTDAAQPEYIFLREAAPGENPDAAKKILTVYATQPTFDLETAINKFNKTNPDYRFELITDGLWGGLEVDRLNRELVMGEAADIMIFDLANPYTMRHPNMEKPAILPFQEYGEIGVFHNLYDYMEADPEFHREDFYQNIWQAFETDGKLYYIPLLFDFDTVIVNPADVGGLTGWTLDELMACVTEKGGRLEINWQLQQGRTDEQSILELCLRTGKWELLADGTFNRELMHKMLTFAHQAGAERTNSEKAAKGGLQLWVYERSSAGNAIDEYAAWYDKWGEYPTNIGYPTENGLGTLIHSYSLAAINKDCQYPEVAWELFRMVLYEGRSVFPLHKDKFSTMYDYAERDDKRMYGSVQDRTTKHTDRLRELAETSHAMSMTLPVEIIIREEAEYYFQGAKPVEEVVDVIANRVTIYLAERE